jgi:hypothetical protein
MVKNLTELASKVSTKTLFVLDIDSSLVLTHKRNEAILHHYAQTLRHKNPTLADQLAKIECRPMEYGYYAALERTIPNIAKSEADELQAYWRHHFFSNDFLHYDIPHEGAIEFVKTLTEKQLPYVYLTGRPSDRMRPGTLTVLDKLGFPIVDKILFMKPNESYIDEGYKADILKEIIRGFDDVIFIDNEPRVLNQIETFYPKVNLVFVDTCHSPNVTAPATALKIKNFSEIQKVISTT